MWAWVLLPLELALALAAWHFYRRTQQAADLAQAAQTAWQTEVEAHLKSLVKELETLLDQAQAPGAPSAQPRWFPAAADAAATPEPPPAALTDAGVVDDAQAVVHEPVAPAAVTATAEDVDARYRAARRMHGEGLDEVSIARATGLEREEVQMLLQWSPAPLPASHGQPEAGATPEPAGRKVTPLVEYLQAAEGAAQPADKPRARRRTTTKRSTASAA